MHKYKQCLRLHLNSRICDPKVGRAELQSYAVILGVPHGYNRPKIASCISKLQWKKMGWNPEVKVPSHFWQPQVANQHMPGDLPGPRSAAFYANRYGYSGAGHLSGTESQVSLLQQQREVQAGMVRSTLFLENSYRNRGHFMKIQASTKSGSLRYLNINLLW